MMAVYGVFGANAVGKDTILRRVRDLDVGIVLLKSSKIFMRAIGFPADPLSSEEPPREWYLCLERLSQKELKKITDTDFRIYLEGFNKKRAKAIATFHLALLKRNFNGKATLYKEETKDWYKRVLKGAVYLRADLNSIWCRRCQDFSVFQQNNKSGKNRGIFTKEEIAFQLDACDRLWKILFRKQFRKMIPCLVLDNSDSDDIEAKISEVACKLKEFIDRIQEDKDVEIIL